MEDDGPTDEVLRFSRERDDGLMNEVLRSLAGGMIDVARDVARATHELLICLV
jgi:hypothetical protein